MQWHRRLYGNKWVQLRWDVSQVGRGIRGGCEVQKRQREEKSVRFAWASISPKVRVQEQFKYRSRSTEHMNIQKQNRLCPLFTVRSTNPHGSPLLQRQTDQLVSDRGLLVGKSWVELIRPLA